MPSPGERLVLSECYQMGGGHESSLDSEIAERTKMKLEMVHNCLHGLNEAGFVELWSEADGAIRAQLTALGRQQDGILFGQVRPRPRESERPKRVNVTPNGLRPFGQEHESFFLDLLPGQPPAGGLPESIQFWKTSIEETNPGKTFGVGVMYGASGSGKSSLVKAGLLPRLPDQIIQLYVDATGPQTEHKLLKAIRATWPDLPEGNDLAGSLAALLRGTALPAGKKFLIVLDQFEQWLFRNEGKGDSLGAALKQCDGGRLQTILVVRDDFYGALTDFIQKLDIEFSPTRSARTIDLSLFTLDHAKQVLITFGQAYGKFDDPLTSAQQDFVDEAVKRLALSRDRIKPIQLVFFVEALRRGKEWTMESLQSIGGVDGVGVYFLKNTFNDDDDEPVDVRYRGHQQGAGKILEALLPTPGSGIRSVRRARQYLLEKSGYEPGRRFDELLNILDEDLRLITPIIQESKTTDHEPSSSRAPEQYYQLTHDYLVPSVRQWRSDNKLKATELVNRIKAAETKDVPDLVKQLTGGLRELANPLLEEAINSDEASKQHLHASLALLPVDREQVRFLSRRQLRASTGEFLVIRDALREAPREFLEGTVKDLWSELGEPVNSGRDCPSNADIAERESRELRVAAALALYDMTNPRWEQVGDRVAQALVRVNARDLHFWLDALRPAREHLTSCTAVIFREKNRPESEREMASELLEEYASDRPELLTELLMDSDEEHFDLWFGMLKEHRDVVVSLLGAMTSRCDLAEDKRDHQARRQARAAVALARLPLMELERVLQLLVHSGHPGVRSYIVNWLNPLGAEPKRIVAELDKIDPNAKPTAAGGQQLMDAVLFNSETSQRRALILSLGTYEMAGERDTLASKLLDLYRNDPDGGIHGAVEWTLRQWDQQKKLEEINAELRKLKDRGERRWFLNSQGETFAVIEGPVEFKIGTLKPDKGREDEAQQPRKIGRRYAIAAKAVSSEQYSQFAREKKNARHVQHSKASRPYFKDDCEECSPEPQVPHLCVSWYDAAAFCNWLSKKEKLESCYEPNENNQYAEGMKVVGSFLERTGYRLPTEAEWEYACRAGSLTSRYYGESEELLNKYAWYTLNSEDRAHPGGELKPNDLGLFDMLGNVLEWCHDQYMPYVQPELDPGSIDQAITLKDRDYRCLRGGAYGSRPTIVRSAVRTWYPMYVPGVSYGFRLARTC